METRTIDALLYKKMIVAGAANLKNHVSEINDLNVFPIPDGDTGDNMLMTVLGGAETEEEQTLGQTSRRIADGMLLSARGNSGVILSQFFDGIAEGLDGLACADSLRFSEAINEGVRHAYAAVTEPTEGTILTVAREAAEFAGEGNAETGEKYLDDVLSEAKSSLLRTPEKLEVLKKAGVVDSGGAGLVCIVEGMRKALDGETAELEGVVLTYPAEHDGHCRYDLRLRLPDGGVTRAVVYDRSGAVIEAEPGWRLRISAYCRAADTRYGEDYDYYNSTGIFLVASVKAPPEVISAQRSAWLNFGQDINRNACAEIERIFPRDTAAFMKSLLIGSREELYEDVGAYMAMGRAGITHIVAISGMHVAFLISILQLALGKSRRSSVLCIIAVWVFVAVTGASPSAVRAGVMQSMLLVAPIFGRENDPPTSLMTALAVLLAANPYSAASVSLQLSFGAVAGLMLFSEKLAALLMPDVPRGTLRRIIRWPVNVAAGSLSVMVLTVPLAASAWSMNAAR